MIGFWGDHTGAALAGGGSRPLDPPAAVRGTRENDATPRRKFNSDPPRIKHRRHCNRLVVLAPRV